jgi:hypothetical protein
VAEQFTIPREKVTKNFVKFGIDGPRLIATLYVPKEMAEGKESLTITVE